MGNTSTELKFDDEYIKEQAKLIGEWANDLQVGIDEYARIMGEIKSNAITSGETANALGEFIEDVEYLKEIVKEMGEETKGMCLSFITEVDEADAHLY